MTDIFLYNNTTGSLELNVHEILLVKEFEALWDLDRNKCSEDPTGKRGYEHEKNLNIFDYLLIGRVHINNI